MNKYTAHLDCVRVNGLHLLECNGPRTMSDQQALAERIAALLNADEQARATPREREQRERDAVKHWKGKVAEARDEQAKVKGPSATEMHIQALRKEARERPRKETTFSPLPELCDACLGTGNIDQMPPKPETFYNPCPKCDGSGRKKREPLPELPKDLLYDDGATFVISALLAEARRQRLKEAQMDDTIGRLQAEVRDLQRRGRGQ